MSLISASIRAVIDQHKDVALFQKVFQKVLMNTEIQLLLFLQSVIQNIGTHVFYSRFLYPTLAALKHVMSRRALQYVVVGLK